MVPHVEMKLGWCQVRVHLYLKPSRISLYGNKCSQNKRRPSNTELFAETLTLNLVANLSRSRLFSIDISFS